MLVSIFFKAQVFHMQECVDAKMFHVCDLHILRKKYVNLELVNNTREKRFFLGFSVIFYKES